MDVVKKCDTQHSSKGKEGPRDGLCRAIQTQERTEALEVPGEGQCRADMQLSLETLGKMGTPPCSQNWQHLCALRI